ncbi:MAG: LysE family transporter [Chloroflexi bacterium]|nr:LysE family transporter [Chloroflexota bacterium]MCC6893004.1 LysE family transporter [Anaerolineae bacterium]
MNPSTIAGSISPLSQGFLLCASIIVALGPQNLFILRQGLRKQHLFATALFSTLADVVLIALGVGGLSSLINGSSFIHSAVTVGGVLFLAWCGGRSLLRAYNPQSPAAEIASHSATTGLLTVIIATLSFSLLNPAAYLDTLVIIGSKSLLFPVDQRVIFGIGAIAASTFWFFTLTYGASKLSPIFRSPIAWRALDVISGFIMLGIAVTMFSSLSVAV